MGCISYRCGFQKAAGIDVHQGGSGQCSSIQPFEVDSVLPLRDVSRWSPTEDPANNPANRLQGIQNWSLERYTIMWVGCWRASWACLRRITTGGRLLKGFTMSLSHESHDIYVDGNSWDWRDYLIILIVWALDAVATCSCCLSCSPSGCHIFLYSEWYQPYYQVSWALYINPPPCYPLLHLLM